MKILIGGFTTESNEKAAYITKLENYELYSGQELIETLGVKDIFEQEQVEIITGYYANANAAGIVEQKSFEYIEYELLESIRNKIHDIDGIYLHLHGASKVENIGSGDFHIIKKIRELIGPYVPIAVSCDPHGNLTKEYVESLQIIRSYRESPHTDAMDTRKYTVKLLIDLIRSHEKVHAIYRKLPLILGGEQSVSADEPVYSINKYMNEIETDSRVMSCSWHVGYLRHDCYEAGCGIVVIPQTQNDQQYCETIADNLAKYVWDRRKEFHYTGTTEQPEKALQMALCCKGKPFVITDSGDNTTSGSTGYNTFVLRQFLNLDKLDKHVLFASIKDENNFNYLKTVESGCKTKINLGKGKDELSDKVFLNITKLSEAEILLVHGEHVIGTIGEGILVRCIDKPVDIIITNKSARVTNGFVIDKFGINWKDYDIVVLKQGYIFPDFKADCYDYVMSLTDGDTPQDTKKIPFKLIMRPMYPIDEI